MEQVIRLLVGSLAQPRMRRINSDRGYRFDEPTTHHFCLLKAVRVVSALNASIELARRGYTQETAVLMRVGLVRLASFIVRDDIAANRLVRVLEEFNPGDIDELHAVYLGQGGLLPIRIRVFLEFLAQQIKIGEARPSREA
jgi:DNA-binding transcriptional LysR family regulator